MVSMVCTSVGPAEGLEKLQVLGVIKKTNKASAEVLCVITLEGFFSLKYKVLQF